MKVLLLFFAIFCSSSVIKEKRGNVPSSIESQAITLERCSAKNLIGKLLNKKYHVKDVIGHGNDSVLYSVLFHGHKYALKCLKANLTESRVAAINEIELIQSLDHPNLLMYIDHFEEFDSIFIVTEFCETDLLEAFKNRVAMDVKQVYTQLLDAVIYQHQNGIYHRDLKPTNILLKSIKEQAVKLGDFGLGTTNPVSGTSFCGTKSYMSPEILYVQSGYSWAKNDCFSLGVILFNLLTKSSPWREPPMEFKIISELIGEFQAKYKFSDELTALFRKIFGYSRNRPSALELKGMFLQLDSFWQ